MSTFEFTPSRKAHQKHANELTEFRPYKTLDPETSMFARECLQAAGVDTTDRRCEVWRAGKRFIAVCPTYTTKTHPSYTFVKLGAREVE